MRLVPLTLVTSIFQLSPWHYVLSSSRGAGHVDQKLPVRVIEIKVVDTAYS